MVTRNRAYSELLDSRPKTARPLATGITTDIAGAELLRDVEAARFLGLGVRTIWKLVSAGKIPKPIHLPGRITRWRRSELTAFVEGLE